MELDPVVSSRLFILGGPSRVTGIVGRSLSVECRCQKEIHKQ